MMAMAAMMKRMRRMGTAMRTSAPLPPSSLSTSHGSSIMTVRTFSTRSSTSSHSSNSSNDSNGNDSGDNDGGRRRPVSSHFKHMQDRLRQRMEDRLKQQPDGGEGFDRAMFERLLRDRDAMELMTRHMVQPVHPDEAARMGLIKSERDAAGQRAEYERYQRYISGGGSDDGSGGGGGGGSGGDGDGEQWEPPSLQQIMQHMAKQQQQQQQQEEMGAAVEDDVLLLEHDPFRKSDMERAMKLHRQQQQQQEEEEGEGEGDFEYEPEELVMTEERRAANRRRTLHYYRQIVQRLRRLAADSDSSSGGNSGSSLEMSLAVLRREFRSGAAGHGHGQQQQQEQSHGQQQQQQQPVVRQDDVEAAFLRAQRIIRTLDAEIAAMALSSPASNDDAAAEYDEDVDDDDPSAHLLPVHDSRTLAETAQEMEHYWEHYYQQEGAVGEWYTDYEELSSGGHLPALSREMDVLVVGGGLSLLGAHLLPHVRTVQDIDICRHTIRAMQKVYETVPEIEYTQMDARDMRRLGGGQFDLVVDKATFDWIMSRDHWGAVDVQMYEAEVWRVLKPGGCLLLVTTTPREGVEYILGGFPWQIEYESSESIIHHGEGGIFDDIGFDMAIHYFRLRKPEEGSPTATD